jgi:high-affinity nickel permease
MIDLINISTHLSIVLGLTFLIILINLVIPFRKLKRIKKQVKKIESA